MRNKILIYNDYGTNDITYLKNSLTDCFQKENVVIKTVNADDIIKKDVLDTQTLAFFMPGGRTTPYIEKLKVQGNLKIKEYVENGGVYFGICAGAYYAGNQVLFEIDIEKMSIIQECGLNLIDAKTIGTLRKELNISPYSATPDSFAVPKICWLSDNEIHYAEYHGGPYFALTDKSKTKVLAEYVFADKRLPAVVQQRYGAGIAIASGVHVENSGKRLKKILQQQKEHSEHAVKMLNLLEDNEVSRLKLFNKLMNVVKVHE